MKRRLTALLLVLLCLPLTACQKQQNSVQCHLVRPV